MLQITHVTTPGRIAATQELFLHYHRWLGLDMGYQNFAAELASLPGEYARPFGRLMLAVYGGLPAGCVALRRLDDVTCEMMRHFVRPELQSLRIGRAMAEHAIAEARAIGYSRMRVNTHPAMLRARLLYEGLGFKEIAPYRHSSVPGTVCMELALPQKSEFVAAAAP